MKKIILSGLAVAALAVLAGCSTDNAASSKLTASQEATVAAKIEQSQPVERGMKVPIPSHSY